MNEPHNETWIQSVHQSHSRPRLFCTNVFIRQPWRTRVRADDEPRKQQQTLQSLHWQLQAQKPSGVTQWQLVEYKFTQIGEQWQKQRTGGYLATFADGAFLPNHSVRVHICDVNGKVPAAAGHAASDRHTQGVIWLLGKSDCLLVAGGLLTGVLDRVSTEGKNFKVNKMTLESQLRWWKRWSDKVTYVKK